MATKNVLSAAVVRATLANCKAAAVAISVVRGMKSVGNALQQAIS